MLTDVACGHLVMLGLQLLLSIVTYCYMVCPIKASNFLKRKINTATRILFKIPKFRHISETLIDLHCFSVQQCVLFKVLILT